MPRLDQIAARFGPRIVLPVIAVLVAALAIVIISLGEMADEVNRIEDRLTARSADAAIHVVLRRIGETHRDYAVWDDAVRNLYGTVNQDFVDDGFVSSTSEGVFFDTFFVVDEKGAALFGYHRGKLLSETATDIYGAPLAGMMASLPRDGKNYAFQTGMLKTEWGLAAVAVGPIVPFSEKYQPPPHAARFLVISQTFDQAVVSRLGSDFLIDGLRLTGAASAGPRSVPITDPSGTVLGALTWSPRALGDQARARISPTVLVMLSLISAMMVFLLAVARRSVVEIRRREAEARYIATHDGLTGLPNRAAVVAEIEKAISEREGGVQVAVIYVDLDRFKEVDEAYGHQTGDRLLKQVALLFEKCAGDRMLAKVGGDEFVFVVTDHKSVKIACDISWKLIESLAEPFDIDGRIILLGASIGVAVADTTHPSADELLRRADVAMYQAKQQGSNRFFVYEQLIDTVRHERLELANDLRVALRANGLTLLYQPVFGAGTREVIGVEALLRWERAPFGPVSPDVLVSVAEESGLIDELSQWMLHRACADARDWPDIRLSVNVSPVQLRNPNFENQVTAILAQTDFPAERLEIDIAEGDLVARRDQARRAIDAIRGRGISVALDDFGTGHSSISSLRGFGFDKIKLSRSLIAGIAHEEKIRKLVRATVALASALDLKVGAGGVENESEARQLAVAGCAELQGRFLAEPCPALEVSALLDSLAKRRPLAAIA